MKKEAAHWEKASARDLQKHHIENDPFHSISLRLWPPSYNSLYAFNTTSHNTDTARSIVFFSQISQNHTLMKLEETPNNNDDFDFLERKESHDVLLSHTNIAHPYVFVGEQFKS